MSIEDDVARVNEVTARLSGPLHVWVLHLYGDHGPDVSLYSTKVDALAAALIDMKSFGHYSVDGNAWVSELDSTGFVQIDGRYNYELTEMVVK